jgi:hypothetical protein
VALATRKKYRSKSMSAQLSSAQWIPSSTALPHDGDAVEFVLDGRKVPLDGTYTRQTFNSRWSGYDIQRVRTWRVAGTVAVA